jgi:hypothetical protein
MHGHRAAAPSPAAAAVVPLVLLDVPPQQDTNPATSALATHCAGNCERC